MSEEETKCQCENEKCECKKEEEKVQEQPENTRGNVGFSKDEDGNILVTLEHGDNRIAVRGEEFLSIAQALYQVMVKEKMQNQKIVTPNKPNGGIIIP